MHQNLHPSRMNNCRYNVKQQLARGRQAGGQLGTSSWEQRSVHIQAHIHTHFLRGCMLLFFALVAARQACSGCYSLIFDHCYRDLVKSREVTVLEPDVSVRARLMTAPKEGGAKRDGRVGDIYWQHPVVPMRMAVVAVPFCARLMHASLPLYLAVHDTIPNIVFTVTLYEAHEGLRSAPSLASQLVELVTKNYGLYVPR
ncbi:hypothetical protein CBL_06231 [Carabus blaptoides fortunei]